jgi:hypothetical protein
MELLDEAREALNRIHEFDPRTLSRQEDLGRKLNFADVVAPAGKLISLYRQLSLDTLNELPDNQLNAVKKIAAADYNRFNEVMSFEIEGENATGRRDTLINQIAGSYQGTFDQLQPIISYGMTRAVDFQKMENDARATIQSIKDQASGITDDLENRKSEVERILEEVRKVAAEQGVSQQARYFKDESDRHAEAAETWRKRTGRIAILLGIYSIAALFLHKIPLLVPTDVYQSAQLITGKVLVFAVFGYMLFLSARNFLSHEHNMIINKHRQNALMTFKALVDAADTEEHSDIVLLHAAQCIFAPQETGYAKQDGNRGTAPLPMFDLMRKANMSSNVQ